MKTEYKLIECENSSWVRIFKGEILEAICMNKESGLHAIWVTEGRIKKRFYTVDDTGEVSLGIVENEIQ